MSQTGENQFALTNYGSGVAGNATLMDVGVSRSAHRRDIYLRFLDLGDWK